MTRWSQPTILGEGFQPRQSPTIGRSSRPCMSLYGGFLQQLALLGTHQIFLRNAQDTFTRDAALYLCRALVEQRKVVLAGASSSLGLVSRQAVEMSTLGNWTPLRSRLTPIPFKGDLLFNEEILQQADHLDKEQEQLKKARAFGTKGGSSRFMFKGRSGGSSTRSPAPTNAPPSQTPSSRGGHGSRSRPVLQG